MNLDSLFLFLKVSPHNSPRSSPVAFALRHMDHTHKVVAQEDGVAIVWQAWQLLPNEIRDGMITPPSWADLHLCIFSCLGAFPKLNLSIPTRVGLEDEEKEGGEGIGRT